MQLKRPPRPGARAADQSCVSISSVLAAWVKRSDGTLRIAAGEFGFQAVPCDAVGAVMVQRRQTALEFVTLRCSHRYVFVRKAVPKLPDEREALGGRQAGDFIRG